MPLITAFTCKLAYQRESQALSHSQRKGSGNETDRRKACMFLVVTLLYTTLRCIRCIVERVKRHQQGIRDCSIYRYQTLILYTGIVECQHIEHHERLCSPEYSWAVFGAFGLCPVGQYTYGRVYNSVHNAGNQHH